MYRKILLIGLIWGILLVSGCVQMQLESPGKGEFKLPESFISLQGPIIAVTSGGCNQDYLESKNLIREDDCESINNMAECIRIPLSLIDYYWDVYQETGETDFFTNKLECNSEMRKAYCQIKMDNEIVIKEGCFDTGLKAITTYSDQPIDISKSHSFMICCSADDYSEEFDVCKSFVMDKIC